MSTLHDEAGIASSDLLVFLATVGLAAVLLYPTWSARGHRARVDRAIADVEVVASSARTILATTGAWPTPAPPGEAPPTMTELAGEESPFGRAEYRIGWSAWNVVDSILAPNDAPATPGDAPRNSSGPAFRPIVRTMGGVAVYASDPSLLAALADRYADRESFVLDSMWLLMLPERADQRLTAP